MNELPQALCTWFAENDEQLRSRGVTGEIQRSPDDGRPKSSAWMTVETDDYGAVLIVWDSGEAELECGGSTGNGIRREHRDLRTVDELHDAVESLLGWVRAKRG